MVAFLTDWSGLLPITPSGQTGYARLADGRRVIPEHAELVGLAVPHRLMLGDQAAGRLSVLDAPAWADLEHDDDERVMVEPDQHTPVAGAQAGLGPAGEHDEVRGEWDQRRAPAARVARAWHGRRTAALDAAAPCPAGAFEQRPTTGNGRWQ
jgi:hypothetical protein